MHQNRVGAAFDKVAIPFFPLPQCLVHLLPGGHVDNREQQAAVGQGIAVDLQMNPVGSAALVAERDAVSRHLIAALHFRDPRTIGLVGTIVIEHVGDGPANREEVGRQAHQLDKALVDVRDDEVSVANTDTDVQLLEDGGEQLGLTLPLEFAMLACGDVGIDSHNARAADLVLGNPVPASIPECHFAFVMARAVPLVALLHIVGDAGCDRIDPVARDKPANPVLEGNACPQLFLIRVKGLLKHLVVEANAVVAVVEDETFTDGFKRGFQTTFGFAHAPAIDNALGNVSASTAISQKGAVVPEHGPTTDLEPAKAAGGVAAVDVVLKRPVRLQVGKVIAEFRGIGIAGHLSPRVAKEQGALDPGQLLQTVGQKDETVGRIGFPEPVVGDLEEVGKTALRRERLLAVALRPTRRFTRIHDP